MRGISCVVGPIPDHAFFEQPKFKRLLCHNLLQVTSFAAQVFDLVACRCTRCVTGKPFLALLSVTWTDGVPSAVHEVFGPFVI